MKLTEDFVLSLIKSGKQFPLSLDFAADLCGYSEKSNAIRYILDNFVPEIDFVVVSDFDARGIMLSIECFKTFALATETNEGREIRELFSDCEKKVLFQDDAHRTADRSRIIEKPVLKVIDKRVGVTFTGQTFEQIAEYVEKKFGIKYTPAEVKSKLIELGCEHFIAQTPRSVLEDYVPYSNLEEVEDLLISGEQ